MQELCHLATREGNIPEQELLLSVDVFVGRTVFHRSLLVSMHKVGLLRLLERLLETFNCSK
jgi:hypothetical protein